MKFRLDRLNKLRRRLKLTQQQVADAVGISKKMISNYENGLGVPDAEHLARLADALKTNTDYLMDRTDYAGALTKRHYRLAELYDAKDRNAIIDLLGKDLTDHGIGKLPITRK